MDVKICGLRRLEDAEIVNQFNDIKYVGFVFADTKRKVSVEQAIEIKKALRADIKTVGVFTDTAPDKINEIAEAVGLDICQLHSDETNDECKQICRPVWKAIRVKDENSVNVAEEYTAVVGFVLDKYKKNEYGGTGERFNWDFVEGFSRSHFTVLAGGLNENNVIEAVQEVMPDVIDLSSSVETDGFKDFEKVKAFMERIEKNGAE